MRVRVLSAASATATTPELFEGEEVDLPDEPALALVEAGTVEAADESDVEKVRKIVEDRHATAEKQFEASKAAEESAKKTAGVPVDEKHDPTPAHKPVDDTKKPADTSDPATPKGK